MPFNLILTSWIYSKFTDIIAKQNNSWSILIRLFTEIP